MHVCCRGPDLSTIQPYTDIDLRTVPRLPENDLSNHHFPDTRPLGQILRDYTPTVDDLDPSEPVVVDGTLLPTRSWRTMPELFSGKHKTTGVNVQVACDPTGRPAFVSDPMPGRTHDAHALKETGLPDHITTGQLIGDNGYIGLGMITPIRTQPKQHHTEKEKRFNKSVNTDTLHDRTSHRQPQNLENPPHRLPQTLPNIPRNNHHSSRTRILQEHIMTKPHSIAMRTIIAWRTPCGTVRTSTSSEKVELMTKKNSWYCSRAWHTRRFPDISS